MVASSIFTDHHIFNFLSLLDSGLQVPFLSLKLLVFFPYGLYLHSYLLNLLLEVSYPLFTLFPHLLNLLLQRLDLVLVNLCVFLGEGDLHFLFDLQHLYLLDHGVEFVDEIFFSLEVQGLLGYNDLACFYLFHYFDLLVGVYDDF